MTMHTKRLILASLMVVGLLWPSTVHAQQAITQTTLSAAMPAGAAAPTTQQITVTSATGMTVGAVLWIEGSVYRISAISSTTITVVTQYMPASHLTSAIVYVVPIQAQISLDPTGSCIRGTTGTFPAYSPYTLMFNTENGHIASCRGSLGSRTWLITMFTAPVTSTNPPVTP